ncbi:MAG TPA: GHKL domain-containing protein [Planctomycetaceae bacterium]|nr:GHKL domain-containing protein [Planctomycetaceae bacterium]
MIDLFEKIDLLAVRCGEIVRNLRQFIRRRTTHVVTVSAHDLIQNALMLVQSSILTANLRVEITVSPDLHVRVDQVQIQQVLVNLIGNAIDAMEQRPPDERVLRLSVQRRGESIEFSVQDTGLGMNPGEAERVFDPFFTTKPQGIGMGLAICKSIVESHGGRIWVESQVGSGTTVYFRVPAEETSAERPVHNEDFGD